MIYHIAMLRLVRYRSEVEGGKKHLSPRTAPSHKGHQLTHSREQNRGSVHRDDSLELLSRRVIISLALPSEVADGS